MIKVPTSRRRTRRRRARTLPHYLKEAFLFRWNLLFLLGGTAAAALTPLAPVLLPLVGAGELAYLAGLISMPPFPRRDRCQGACAHPSRSFDDVACRARRFADDDAERACPPSRARDSNGCTRAASRCAASLPACAARPAIKPATAEDIRTPGLDRLLWLFLRLLLSKTALDRFLKTMDGQEISDRLEELRKNLAAAQTAGDDRVVRSLQDSIAMGELRLDNFGTRQEERRVRHASNWTASKERFRRSPRWP